ncbi:cystathionine beta-lyase [Rhodovibrio salinarum]|uniref:Cystathionine beta-lyase n=1 Tax=Rhodovibrio salinarum TaxID=1087 RepID=A0A934QKS2_9PROT|nr:cystathionine beta-lyase [Rhodovibrio salinarum]MBK1698686.1 cystathionine beta-lyase [Rhodovibrio salinarum]
MSDKRFKRDTRLGHLGRDPARFDGAVNPPVYHASTVIAPDTATFKASGRRRFEKGETVYGRFGTPTHQMLEDALSELEGGADTVALGNGLQAVVVALLTVAKAGDHVLLADSVYAPTRKFADQMLTSFGVEVDYYDPLIDGAGLDARIRANTVAVVLESPGSSTFEVQDVPALAAAAKARGVATIIDNTWATPLFFRPIEHGVDLSVQAATKYIVGHADAMLGAVTASDAWANRLRETVYTMGGFAGPDDVYLGLRGLRTMGVRLERHQASALKVATWLQERPEVAEVRYPALPEHPQHHLWQRDFDGASGLFSIVLAQPYAPAAVAAMLDHFDLFGLGASWGGFESLAIPSDPHRTATTWEAPGPVIRLHIGLEDPDDLIADLDAGFARLTRAAG